MPKSTGKKGQRKIGRMLRSPAHMRYNAENRRDKNKIKKVKKHLKAHPSDLIAVGCLRGLTC